MTDTLEFIRVANDMRLFQLNIAAYILLAVPAVFRFAHWLESRRRKSFSAWLQSGTLSAAEWPHQAADALAGRVYYCCAVVYLALNVIL